MKVYVAVYYSFEEVLGVFSTFEKADEYRNRFPDLRIYIEEFVIDEVKDIELY